MITVYLSLPEYHEIGDWDVAPSRRRLGDVLRVERVPHPLGSGLMIDTLVVRVEGTGQLIRTDADGGEMSDSPYAADRKYGADGRDLGPAD